MKDTLYRNKNLEKLQDTALGSAFRVPTKREKKVLADRVCQGQGDILKISPEGIAFRSSSEEEEEVNLTLCGACLMSASNLP
jgi:hypothetical protein